MRFAGNHPQAWAWLRRSRSYVDQLDISNLQAKPGARVLISGFGPFGPHSFNMTGALVQSLTAGATRTYPAPSDEPMRRLVVQHASATEPARAAQRTVAEANVTLPGGRQAQLVSVVLPTLWDTAALLLLRVARQLRPQLIIMNGIANDEPLLRIETGARNRAAIRYDASSALMPSADAPAVVSQQRVDQVLPMSLDFMRVTAAAKQAIAQYDANASLAAPGHLPLARSLSDVQQQTPGREENAFVCNATSYAVLAGLRATKPLQLLEFAQQSAAQRSPAQQPPAQVLPLTNPASACAFLHWPCNLPAGNGARFVLQSIIAAQLNSALATA